MTDLADLAAFLLERFSEEEAKANSWRRMRTGVPVPTIVHDIDGQWATWGDPATFDGRANGFEVTDQMREQWYEPAPDASVLADCAAKRAIVQKARSAWDDSDCTECNEAGYLGDSILRLLAVPYSGHPDFRSEWTV